MHLWGHHRARAPESFEPATEATRMHSPAATRRPLIGADPHSWSHFHCDRVWLRLDIVPNCHKQPARRVPIEPVLASSAGQPAARAGRGGLGCIQRQPQNEPLPPFRRLAVAWRWFRRRLHLRDKYMFPIMDRVRLRRSRKCGRARPQWHAATRSILDWRHRFGVN